MAKRNRIGNWNSRKILDGPQDAGGTTSKGIRGIYQVESTTDSSGLSTSRTRRILGGLLQKEERGDRAAEGENFTRTWKSKSDPFKSRTTEFRENGSGTVTTVSKLRSTKDIDHVDAGGRFTQRQQSFPTHSVTITPREDGGYVKEVAQEGQVQRKQYGAGGKLESKAVSRSTGGETSAIAPPLRRLGANRFRLDEEFGPHPPEFAGAATEHGSTGLHRLTSTSSRSSADAAQTASEPVASGSAGHDGSPRNAVRRLQEIARNRSPSLASTLTSDDTASIVSTTSGTAATTVSRTTSWSSAATEVALTARKEPKASGSLRGLRDRGVRSRDGTANEM